MGEKMSGVLRIKKIKKGNEYRVEIVNARGKTVSYVVYPIERYFDLSKVVDGDPVEFELAISAARNCVVPGKEAEPPEMSKESENAKQTSPRSDLKPGQSINAAYGSRGKKGGNRGFGGAPGGSSQSAQKSPALTNAVAPYNWLPYATEAILPPLEDSGPKWSGALTCKLTALTPLLVSGQQKAEGSDQQAECRFLQVGDKPVIPGSSLRGMIRSLVEILAFASLEPMTKEPLFWRNVAGGDYRGKFPQEADQAKFPNNRVGGFLRKEGASYFITPAGVKPMPWEDRKKYIEKGEFETGGITTRGKHSCWYLFTIPATGEKSFPVDREVISDFLRQMTDNQKGRWEKAQKSLPLNKWPGSPVFYRAADINREASRDNPVQELGLCRYFRLKYDYTPYDLAHPDGKQEERDFATNIFGGAKKGDIFRGRVSFGACFLEGKPLGETRAILGNPRPTCLPLYLQQDPAKVHVFKNNPQKNDPQYLKNYSDKEARLRGRKLYWHHDVNEKYWPEGNKNEKVKSRLFPLDEGATGEFTIQVDRLSSLELGALLSALELPQGQAHKLGMGKSLGFGSIRLEIKEARLAPVGEIYKSLARRLTGQALPEMNKDARQKMIAAFQAAALAKLRELNKDWSQIGRYEDLPQIKALAIMLDYSGRPPACAVRTMKLRDPNEFGNNAILLGPDKINRKC